MSEIKVKQSLHFVVFYHQFRCDIRYCCYISSSNVLVERDKRSLLIIDVLPVEIDYF